MSTNALPPVTFDSTCYRVKGRPTYIYSGEFHYFRVPRKDWRKRMRLFKAAGGNCLATYCPWLIHEPQEGTFVFGEKGPQYDLEGFLQTAAEEELYVVARPGPYQYSELHYDGLAGWLCEQHPELRAQDFDGKPFRTSSVSYLHPLFMAKVARWFDAIIPRIAPYTVSRGGPVAFVQFDNEMAGIHTWFGSLDYNAATMGFGNPQGRYPRYLQSRYGRIERLNAAYVTEYEAFVDVRPLKPAGGGTTPAEIRRVRDYFWFYLGTVAEYGLTLARMLRERGIDTPFVHNSAGPVMNAWFKPLVDSLQEPFVLGSDHYYCLSQEWGQNNPTPQYAISAFYSLEMLRTMGYPPTVYELPGGSLSDWPPITPQDAKACYLANIALGMKGSNFYILTGGPNIPGTGTTADVYDYGSSIGAFGEVRPLYKVQKEVGLLLKRKPWLVAAERQFDFRVTLDYEQALASNYWKAKGDFLLNPADAWTFVQRGLLTTSFCASLAPAMVDLGSDAWCVDTRTPVVVVGSAVMARSKQERIVRFLKGGGRALIVPVLPTHDEDLIPCTVLTDFLGGARTVRNTNQYSRVSVAGVANVYNNGDVFLLEQVPAGADVVGVDEITGKPLACQWRVRGGGQVLVLGFRWSHGKREHEAMLAALLTRLGLEPVVQCSNSNIWCSLRTDGSQSALFVMNLLTAPMEVEVKCRPAWSPKTLSTGLLKLPAMTVQLAELGQAERSRAKRPVRRTGLA